MMRNMFAVLLVICLLGGAQGAEEAPLTGQPASFWAEFEGRVAIESDQAGSVVVRIVPDAGLSLALDKALVEEWRDREGRRVEVEGRIYGGAADPRMEVWKFSYEDKSRHKTSALETEGKVAVGEGAPILRTRLGDVPLVDAFAGAPAGALVDVKATLVARGDDLALSVLEMELDD